ncbi:hypothetical protein ACFX2G_047835 [Malus domestica]
MYGDLPLLKKLTQAHNLGSCFREYMEGYATLKKLPQAHNLIDDMAHPLFYWFGNDLALELIKDGYGANTTKMVGSCQLYQPIAAAAATKSKHSKLSSNPPPATTSPSLPSPSSKRLSSPPPISPPQATSRPSTPSLIGARNAVAIATAVSLFSSINCPKSLHFSLSLPPSLPS